MIITTAQLYSTKPEFSSFVGSNPNLFMSKICDYEDSDNWTRLEIRLNVFCWSAIPQKIFITFIIIVITLIIIKLVANHNLNSDLKDLTEILKIKKLPTNRLRRTLQGKIVRTTAIVLIRMMILDLKIV